MSTEVYTRVFSANPLVTKETAAAETTKTHIKTHPEALFPQGGWDVHHHIFDPQRFEYAPDRHLTPPTASIRQFLDFKSRLGLTHSVLTHGLSYGDDCSSLKTFVPELGQTQTFAIGVIDPTTITRDELQSMHEAGIRGIRINLYKYGAMHDVELQKHALREHAAVLKQYCPGWSMAFTHIHPEFWGELSNVVLEIANAGIPLVTDHFALLKATSMLPPEYRHDVTSQPGFSDIIKLLKKGALYIKVSAPYRISDSAPKYHDIRPIVEAFVKANPKRVLWGSDWPHTPRMKVRTHDEALKETPFLEVDDELWLRSLKSWLTPREWDLIMVGNPSELYSKA